MDPEDADRVKTQVKRSVRLQILFPSFRISKIALYEREQRVGEFAPAIDGNEIEWTPGPVGETELKVVVEGVNGDKFIPDPRRVKIVPNAPPDVRLTHTTLPLLAGRDGLVLSLRVTDPDGKKDKKPTTKKVKVDVYNFGQLIVGKTIPFRSDNSRAPNFIFAWERTPAGTYSIRVVATDKDGYTTRLKPIDFTLAPPQ